MLKDRTRGILIALGGVLAVSPDAMLLRWMKSLGASSPDVAVAKYIGIIACMIIIGGSSGLSGARASRKHFLASAAAQTFYQLSFTFCLLLTDAAKALLLISLAPLWAALLGMVVLGESLPRRTSIALIFSVCSVGLVFMPRLVPSLRAPGYVPTQDSLPGDLIALAAGFAQGTSLTVSRHAALHSPQSDLTLATALSSLVATVVAIELPCYDLDDAHNFWACTPPVWKTPAFVVLAALDALAVALFYTSMLVAPRYITGGEVALVMLCEDVLGPLWIFFRFGDIPSPWTFAGGAVLLSTLAMHECAASAKGGRKAVPVEASLLPEPSRPESHEEADAEAEYQRM